MSEDKEIRTYFGRCRCCLNYGYLKRMWAKHFIDDVVEIYGEMLIQCFAISFQFSESSMEEDQICDPCIMKLREATEFKKIILDVQEELNKLRDKGEEYFVKIENPSDHCEALLIEQHEQEDINEHSEHEKEDVDYFEFEEVEFLEEDHKPTPEGVTNINKEIVNGDKCIMKVENSSKQLATGDPLLTPYKQMDIHEYSDIEKEDIEDIEFEEVEFLEEENRPVMEDISRRIVSDFRSQQSKVINKPVKKSKKLPNRLRYKTYKQYSAEDLTHAVEAVYTEKLSVQEASDMYNIPKKTIESRVRTYNEIEIDVDKEKTYNYIKELKTMLAYTNVTPFKSKTNNRFLCAYCTYDGPEFDDPNDLRSHTRTTHINDRTTHIEFVLRPYWLNPVLRVDIKNLLCNVCCDVIDNWNDMFSHLRNKHKVVLDQAYTRVIPYILDEDFKCALCMKQFNSFPILNNHMNDHYDNHICQECGATFITSHRLMKHVETHVKGKYPCQYCHKVFALKKYKRKHEKLMHEHVLNYKCWHCTEQFDTERLRHLHLLDKHEDKIKIMNCELCEKSFTWRPYFVAHMKKKHKIGIRVEKHECDICGNSYYKKNHLERHVLAKHSGKNIICDLCPKAYLTIKYLENHYIKVHNKILNVEQYI